MKDPFETLLKNVIGNSQLRPRRRTIKVNEGDNFGTAKVPYGETEVKITVDDLKEQYQKQNGKSYWLGYDLNPHDIHESNNNAAMSVDRIDNSKGYIKDNFVICTRFANLGRRTISTDKFISFIDNLKCDIRKEIRKNSIEKFI